MASFFIFFLVILAALFHSIWNALVKHSQEREIVLGFIALGHFCLGFLLSFFVPSPSWEAWKFILISTLVHFLYYFGLHQSYRRGDLSIVYPIARGIVPPLVTLGGWMFAGENLSPLTWSGIFICSLGIILFAVPLLVRPQAGHGDSRLQRAEAVSMAIITGIIITSYSLLDGLGGRITEDPLTYIAWLFILEIFVFFWVLARNRKRLKTISVTVYQRGIIGGWIAALTYAVVIYAKSQTELGVVSALRETSIVFATLIGVFLFKERPLRLRLMASLIVVVGVVILFFGY